MTSLGRVDANGLAEGRLLSCPPEQRAWSPEQQSVTARAIPARSGAPCPPHDLYDAMQDARSEARYTCDPCAEPDTGEVKDTLARMGLEATERGAAGLMFRG